MKRPRQLKKKQNHFCIFINRKSEDYNFKNVRKLTGEIRRKGHFYTVFESRSASEMVKTANKACGLIRWGRSVPDNFFKRGKATALIACGGDGTFNLIAKVAADAKIPVGLLPMGRENNIAKSLLGDDSLDNAVKKIIKQNYRLIDHASIGQRFIFGSAGIGFTSETSRYLSKNSRPRFGMTWNKCGSKIAGMVKTEEMVVKIEAFRFEIEPTMVQINLLPYTNGLSFSPASIDDDRQAELIFDMNCDKKGFGNYLKNIFKGSHIYGTDIRLYRGRTIYLEGVKGRDLYFDGDIIKLSEDNITIEIQEKQLKVFC